MRFAIVILTLVALLLSGVMPVQAGYASLACPGEAALSGGSSDASCCSVDEGESRRSDDEGETPASRCRSCLTCHSAATSILTFSPRGTSLLGSKAAEPAIVSFETHPLSISSIPAVPPPRA